ncbi:hypothetical protein ABLA85_15020 [Xenorhabdus sp. SGI246]
MMVGLWPVTAAGGIITSSRCPGRNATSRGGVAASVKPTLICPPWT